MTPTLKNLQDRAAQLETFIDQATAAGFLTAEGKCREVLGTLAITADGHILGSMAKVFVLDQGEVSERIADSAGVSEWTGDDVVLWGAHDCYSTREAAKVALAEEEWKHAR